MRKGLFVVICLMLIFISCAPIKKLSVYYEFKEIPNTDYTLVTIKAFYNDLPIDIDSAICKRILFSIKIKDGENLNKLINSKIWLPQDSVSAKNKLCLLIPPVLGNIATMYPFAVKLVKKNIPVVFLSYHGVKNDLMENYDVDYGLKEIDDGITILKEVPKYLNYDSLVTVIYGVSLGGVIALNIAANHPNIKALALEALPYDLEKTSKKMFSKSVSEIAPNLDLKKIEDYQPSSSIKKINNKINVQALWSSFDKYISKDDIDSLINLFKENKNEFEYHLINKKMHHFRYVYPLTKIEYDSLNNLIVNFIFKNLYE